MGKKLGILFAAFEAVPFIKTGGLGDVAGSLPKALNKKGCDVRVILPKLSQIPEEYKAKMTHVADFYLDLSWRKQYCGIETLKHNGVIYYFVDNEFYFNREKAYGFFDDGERMAFFSKAITECISYLPDFDCDILHCNDWHTSLAPVFLREFYQDEKHKKIKTVFSVHNLKFQGQMSDYVLGDILGLASIPAAANQLRSDRDSINFVKGALLYSDLLSTVSPSYASEIQDPFYGENMEGIFRRRSGELYGILNGIDTVAHDPAKDPMIPFHYDKKDFGEKKACKKALQEELGLEVNDAMPIFIMIGRLTQQKGLDLLTCVIHEIMQLPLQLVILGTGDYDYEEQLRAVERQYPNKMRSIIKFDNDLSHRMYAAGDVLLMPSLFEPCGLSQMIAMRYGTLPLVRETGGLRDSVRPYNEYTGKGTGFSFANYNAHEMLDCIRKATELYVSQQEAWQHLMQQAMKEDFSWNKAAKDYIAMYRRLVPEETEDDDLP